MAGSTASGTKAKTQVAPLMFAELTASYLTHKHDHP